MNHAGTVVLKISASTNFSCHPQCNESFGCWGPDNTQCAVCKSFEYNERCFENCGDFNETGRQDKII